MQAYGFSVAASSLLPGAAADTKAHGRPRGNTLSNVDPYFMRLGKSRGRAFELRDLLIFAIARAHHLGVATRNVGNFRGFGIPVYDPFADAQLR